MARLARLSRMLRLLKVFVYFFTLYRHVLQKVDGLFKTNNFHYIAWITISTVIIGALGMTFVEHMSFGNALWWAFVTATTVGYGDISPATPLGRVIAVILMLVGIGFLGMLTGTISTFFINRKREKSKFRNEIIECIKNKLDNFEDLDKSDINDICKMLQSLKQDKRDYE